MGVTITDIERAQARIQPYVHRTPLMTSQLIDRSVANSYSRPKTYKK